MARRVGFEPTEAFTSSVFKTDAIIHLGHLRIYGENGEISLFPYFALRDNSLPAKHLA